MREITIRKKLIKDLNEVKENLGVFTKDNYEKIYKILEDFDDENCTDYIDELHQSDFLEEDDLEYFLEKEMEGGVDRLRCFIGDTYSDDMYRLDGYGNLANITQGDFENLIDDLTYHIKQDIKDLKQTEL